MKIALITVTMAKLENNYAVSDAELQVALVDKKNEEVERRLIDGVIEKAPDMYPGWTNFKAKVSYVPDEILIGWINE